MSFPLQYDSNKNTRVGKFATTSVHTVPARASSIPDSLRASSRDCRLGRSSFFPLQTIVEVACKDGLGVLVQLLSYREVSLDLADETIITEVKMQAL